MFLCVSPKVHQPCLLRVERQTIFCEPLPSLPDRTGNLLDQANALTGTVPSQFVANLLSQGLGYTVSPGKAFHTTSCSPCVFPNAVVPQSAWSAPSQHLLQYIPQPNVGSNVFSNASFTQRISDDKGSVRMDANTRLGNLSAYDFIDNYDLNNP